MERLARQPPQAGHLPAQSAAAQMQARRRGAPADERPAPSSPLRVVVMNTEFHTGGAESISAQLFTALGARGHQVDWCALYRPGPTGNQLRASGQALASGFMRSRADAWGFSKAVAWLAGRRPDVVWFITQPATVFWAQLGARLVGAACVGAVHNTIDFESLGPLHPYRILLRSVDSLVCVADGQRLGLLQQGPGLRAEQVCRIYNGVDVPEARPDQRMHARRSLGIEPGALVVGLVARLYPIKGVDIFLRAARLALEAEPALHFVAVGDGPEAASLRALAAELGLQTRLQMCGHREDVRDLLPAFDIGVLSSRSEALPIGVLEYMAAGLPVVAADVGSVNELLVHGSTGELVAAQSPAALADAIVRLARSPDTRAAWGAAGRARVQAEFSLQSSVQQVEALCQSLRRR